MPKTYTLFLTFSEPRRLTLYAAASESAILCTDNCGVGNSVPGMGESTVLMPAVRGTFLSFSSLTGAQKTLGAAAAETIAVELDGLSSGHAVVVLHWAAAMTPPRTTACDNCPPDTLLIRYPSTISPAASQRVLAFNSADEAEAWVASENGQEHLRNAVYVRVHIPA